MNKKNLLIVLGVLILLGAGYVFFFGDSPEVQVRKRLDDLCQACSKAVGESGPTRILKAESLNTIFADPVEISGDASILAGRYTPEELSSRIFTGSRMFETIRLSYTDLSITMQGSSKASISFTAKLSVIAKAGGQSRQDDFRQVAAELVRTEDDRWAFTKFKVIQVMEK